MAGHPPRLTKYSDKPAEVNVTSGAVVDAALAVHSALGPGLLERTYRTCLAYELEKRGHRVECEVPAPIFYDGRRLHEGYRLDLLVDERVIVEVKAVEELHPVHKAQLLTYLKLTGCHIGLLINFNTVHLKDGIRRVAQRQE